MAFSEPDFAGAMPIDGFGPGFFRVNGALHHGPLLMTPQGPRAWAGPGAGLPGLEDIDLVLFGMGDDIAPVPAALRAGLAARGLGFEPMSTPSAARLYNLLLTEGRRVAAALLPIAGTR